ncbi:hypothetical protein ACFFGF_04860 [Asaia lannensis]|uniref:Uncharacterized protein n=1 Tax=Asaia lannensis NBRC 102526 TaxID=1307926 RepID=A0ABT1CIG0_9PROT|nr:hypothetical protein [Asaia lannensis]MCO6160655.1 hypothetical protein [Asaia lannensis NBRC 102526]GBR02074.1 hypothetical protein AA102526_2709 [Asaia lannensis NBRC 102526]
MDDDTTTHAYDRPLIDADERGRTQGMTTPVIALDILRQARLWSVLHPHAASQTRQRLVEQFAAAVGVVVVI